MSEFRLSAEHDGDPSNIGVIGGNIEEFNAAAVGYSDQKRVAFYLRDLADEIVGGLYANTYWDCLDISLVWVREDLRGRGFGTQLLEAAEREALERGCRQAMLDTFSFQAPGFYLKNGYEVFGEIGDFAGEHARYYFRKTLQ
jgi:GNAT superfamily N-acetyltransferase